MHVSLLPAYVQVLRSRLPIELTIVLSATAHRFVSDEALCALTGRPTHGPLDDVGSSGAPRHVEIGEWADLVLVLPASANTIAKLAGGFASDLGSAVVLAASCPIAVAPAMRQTMWESAAVKRNVAQLKEDGVDILQPRPCPAAGALDPASGAEEGLSSTPALVLKYLETLKQREVAA